MRLAKGYLRGFEQSRFLLLFIRAASMPATQRGSRQQGGSL
jgi:hypothetical protein